MDLTDLDPCSALILAMAILFALRTLPASGRPTAEQGGLFKSAWTGWLIFLGLALLEPRLLPLWLITFTGFVALKGLRGLWTLLTRLSGAVARAGRTAWRRVVARWHARRAARTWERQQPLVEARERQRQAAQRRREDARARAELFYTLHAPVIGTHLTRELVDDFIARYLGDDRPPDYVEERSQQLQETIRQLLGRASPAPPPRAGLTELAAWYERTRQQILAQPLEERRRKALLAQLNLRYDELAARAMEELEP